jgi:hypothetical protein
MSKISWRMTSCFYPASVHSHSALSCCTLLEMLCAFGLCVLVKQPVAATSSPVDACTFRKTTQITPRRSSVILVCTSTSIYCDHCMFETGLFGFRNLTEDQTKALCSSHSTVTDLLRIQTGPGIFKSWTE